MSNEEITARQAAILEEVTRRLAVLKHLLEEVQELERQKTK
jgi:hypothetical protein